MKKGIFLLVGVLTFSVSFWLINSRSLVVPVSLCEISENPNLIKSGQIHVKAFLAKGGYYDVISGMEIFDMNNGCLVGANLEIPETFESNEILTKLKNDLTDFRNLPEYRNRDGWAIIEVEFIGEVEDLKKYHNSHSRDFNLKPSKIKRLSPIKFISPQDISALNKYLN